MDNDSIFSKLFILFLMAGGSVLIYFLFRSLFRSFDLFTRSGKSAWWSSSGGGSGGSCGGGGGGCGGGDGGCGG